MVPYAYRWIYADIDRVDGWRRPLITLLGAVKDDGVNRKLSGYSDADI